MPDTIADTSIEEMVRETAYFLWEQDGKPEGRDQEYWYRAEQRTQREHDANGEIGRQPRHTHQVAANQAALGRPVTN